MEKKLREFEWCKIPFNMMICGMTDCGKTHFILDLLEKEFSSQFHDIVLFCPTVDFNQTYIDRKWIDKDSKIYILPPDIVNEDLDNCLKDAIVEFQSKDRQTLFIEDDCANLWESKNKCTKLTELAFSGRHKGISVWLLTQKYNAVSKDFRENCKHIVLHALNDRVTWKQIFEENMCFPVEEKINILKRLSTGNTRLIGKRIIPWDFKCVQLQRA